MSVYHLAYRPKSINELDLSDVRDNLSKFLGSEDKPQAFLFCGPKGSGKTSAARILAKMLNGLKEDDKANYLDIIELDAASNRGIDDVRLLREQAYLLPAQLNKKVFIIDEAHMLTREAFNALLKILEEPPQHTAFVLCTTQPADLPETIVSRLVRLNFRKATLGEVGRAIDRVVESEGIKLDDKVKMEIFKHCEGSFRNASRLLNELVINYGKDLTKPEIIAFFEKKSGGYLAKELAEDLMAGKSLEAIQKIEREAQAGVDMGAYTVACLEFFQKQLFNGENLLGNNLTQWLKLLLEACRQLIDSPIAQLPLQLAIVEFAKDLPVISRTEKSEDKVDTEKVNKKVVQSVGAAVAPVLLTQIEEVWPKLLLEVGLINKSVSAFLKAARPKEVDGNCLMLEVFYSFHKEKIEDHKNRLLIEACLERFLQTKVELICKLGILENKSKIVSVEVPAIANPTSVDETQTIYNVAKEIFG